MKKICVLLVLCSLGLVSVGCDKKPAAPTSGTTTTTPDATTTTTADKAK